ncbi:hypothetical protein NP493_1109g00077 [Ridgeia piscesae]|uniref:von Hippel-Lindau disease tumour suppressor beta domain-containing protein n=1 Tax=Ridgeia piscesae TaxID=27915 RepID=A0AAD9KIB1_RIDPI|nr:hypothetical protein NP493_1109g00077 [Ridgeia piscesae]
MSVGTDGGEQPRSIQSELFSYIRFINRTQQTVDLFWMNYAGERVKYITLLPGGQFSVETFATHPWIFRDAISGYPLRVEGQEVFYPQPWDPGHSRQCKDVFIDLSYYTLKDICKQVVSSHYTSEQLKKLSPTIPADLLLELLHRDPSVPGYSVSPYYQI